MKLSLALKETLDRFLQRNLLAIQDAWNGNPLTRSEMQLRTIDVPGAISGFKFPHNLGYTPKDVIITSAIGLDGSAFSGTIAWNFDKFDGTNLNLTTSAGCTLRVIVGILS